MTGSSMAVDNFRVQADTPKLFKRIGMPELAP
jgi:hypothetical protein